MPAASTVPFSSSATRAFSSSTAVMTMRLIFGAPRKYFALASMTIRPPGSNSLST